MAQVNTSTQTDMTYVRLGTSGLKVSRLILGCMSYGICKWQGWILDSVEGIEQIKMAYDLGINTFDTANAYSNGLSEVVLGKAIKQHNLPRDEIVVMTKVYSPVAHDPLAAYNGVRAGPAELEKQRYTNQFGLSRKHIFESIKHSLERLNLDYVDVLQCHRFDYNTPIEETMQALHDVVKAVHKMQNYGRAHGLTEFISMQNYHCAIYREDEREMVPLLQDLGVGMIPWSPLGRGFLTRPVSEQTKRMEHDPFQKIAVGNPEETQFLTTINERIAVIAKTRNVTMAQVAITWTLSKPYITAPIVGTTKIDNLKELIAGIHLKLTEEEVKSIDEPYQPRPIVVHG